MIRSALSHMRARAARFAQDTAGTITAETLVILVPLCWCYFGTFVFFDALRTQNLNQKAAYTIADMLSRQTAGVDDAYIQQMQDLFDYLTLSQGPASLRISSVRYKEDTDEHILQWSRGTKTTGAHTQASLNATANKIPAMPDGDVVIIVETFTEFTPLSSNVGIDPRTLTSFIVTRPRFAPLFNWAGT
jgi:Flp pilus assembly protein TadG